MIPLATFRELYDYNYWARDQQLEACRALTPEQFTRPMGNSFPSVRDTLAHVLGAELVWCGRWRGRALQEIFGVGKALTLQEFIQQWPQQFSSVADLEARWQAAERDLREYLAGLSEDALSRPLTYVNFLGQTWSYPLWRTMLHLVNHGSYHRGQVTTLLRQLGAQPTPLDLLVGYDAAFRKQ